MPDLPPPPRKPLHLVSLVFVVFTATFAVSLLIFMDGDYNYEAAMAAAVATVATAIGVLIRVSS